MILDDGGDVTMLIHKGVQYEKAGVVPPTDEDDSEEYGVILDLLRASLADRPDATTRAIAPQHPGRHRGDHHRRAAAVPAGRGRRAAVPGDQRQRLGHQEQVRQQVRLSGTR